MTRIAVLAKIAALRFRVGAKTGKFSVRLSSQVVTVMSDFQGSGEVEMNEETFEVTPGDVVQVVVLEDDHEIHRVDIPLLNIETQSDWSILQQEDFEVRIQFLITKRVPRDFVENALDILSGPRAWYLKAEDLYELLKSAAAALNLPTGKVAENVSRLVDLATEAVVKKFAPLTYTEEVSVLQSLDQLLQTQCARIDKTIDASRAKLVNSLRQLKASLEASANYHRRRAQELANDTIAATKDIATKAVDSVNTTVESSKAAVSASVEDTKALVAAHVESAKATTTASIDGAKAKVTALSEDSKQWATQFLSARIIQAKDLLAKAQPYVVQAVDVSQPYAAKAVSIAEPYVNIARPYVEPVISEARKLAENNQYVGPYVAPLIDHANHAISEAKTYCGVGEKYFEEKKEGAKPDVVNTGVETH